MAIKKTPKKVTKKARKEAEKIEEITSSLNERQKLFAQLYTTDKFCFGNASKSYAEAYNFTPTQAKKMARQMGYKLLTNTYIQKYIKEFLHKRFDDNHVDRETTKIITQDKDLKAKVSAISEYNKVKNRISQQPVTGPITIHIAPEILAKM